MKKIIALVFALCMLFALSVIASAQDMSVITATSKATTKLSSLSTGTSGIFLGWFETEDAAKSLDTAAVAADGYVGTVYGAVVKSDNNGLSVKGAEFCAEPTGVRFLVKIDKGVIDVIESVNALNRKGRNGTFTPANEHKTDIGYGTVLAIDVDKDSAITKTLGGNVRAGACVPGVFIYDEDDTSITYTATVIGSDIASYADKIAARPYITYADANGNVRTVYYTNSDSANCAYAASVYEVATAAANGTDEVVKTAAETVLKTYAGGSSATKVTIESLNTDSHSFNTGNSYIELDRSTLVALNENTHSRYQNAFYPRITRVKDDLYLMTLNYSQEGMHLYYVTSTDGVTWGAPKVLYNAAGNTFTHTFGSLKGTEDAYYATTADHCLLDDGTILCVYSRRPCTGYALEEYASLSTLELVKGTVSGSTIKWSTPVSIYHGQNWESEILQRSDGTVEIYFTHIAPMLYKYGWQDKMRSSGVGMISSTDRGNTWTPNVTSAPYAAKRVYQFAAGNLKIDGKEVPFVHGQMPGVVELAAGDKMMLVAETRTVDRSYHMISKAYSNAGCEWTALGISEAGPSNTTSDVFRGAAPTLMRFDSGEILLTYNNSSMLYSRLLNDRGTNMGSAYENNIFYNNSDTDGGFWSSSAPIDSHTAILAMSYKRWKGAASETTTNDAGEEVTTLHNTTVVGKVRLNHTINATKKNVVADGNPHEWKNIKDALFVGSLSPTVQATYRFAYDDDYIYAIIDRTDSSNSTADYAFLKVVNAEGTITTALLSLGDYTLPAGVTGGVKRAVGGMLYEIRFDRAALGLTGDVVHVFPGFYDDALGSQDYINGATKSDTSTWMKLNLK